MGHKRLETTQKYMHLLNLSETEWECKGATNKIQKTQITKMRFMRHKKLETTLHYIRSITLDEPTEYKTVAIQTGQPDTQKEILEYANAGYSFFDEADGFKYYRIRK